MKHARPDYDRIQDPAGKIPDDEPVMLFRAQDKLASEVVEFYAKLCLDHGLTEIAAHAHGHAAKMRVWHTQKLPDLPPRGDPLRNNPVVGWMSEKQAEGILEEMRAERRGSPGEQGPC